MLGSFFVACTTCRCTGKCPSFFLCPLGAKYEPSVLGRCFLTLIVQSNYLCFMIKEEKQQVAITVNGTRQAIPESTTVEQLLAQRGLLEASAIAVAVNNKVVRRQNWATCELVAGDSVVLLTAVQGG